MPNRKPFPSKEEELNTYFRIVVLYVTTHFSRLHVSELYKTTINEAFDEWKIVYPLSKDLNYRTKMTVARKNRLKETLMTTLREIFADIPQSALTIEDRNTIGLAERKSTRSTPKAPATYPIGQIDTGHRLQHTISYVDQDGSLGKPKGARGCQIWMNMGEPVTDVSQLRFLASNSASPYLHIFDIQDVGKSVQYWLRWENTRGETGPWSAVVRATVNG